VLKYKDEERGINMQYFDASYLPEPSNEYVCWMDIMGTQIKMSNSLKTCANFIFKLHSSVIQNKKEGIRLYPVMDGVYITSSSQREITSLLTNVFYDLTTMFIEETEIMHKFFIKASLAYGPIIHGNALPDKANYEFKKHQEYKNSILLGLPMVQAFKNESLAPPFGVFVDESARAFCPEKEQPMSLKWWQWFRYIPEKKPGEKNEFARTLYKKMEDYFKWAKENTYFLDYDISRIEIHNKMAQQFFNTKNEL